MEHTHIGRFGRRPRPSYALNGTQATQFDSQHDGRWPLGDRLDCVESLKLPVLIPVIRQVQFAAVVKLVRTMLWTWGRGRPWGLVWCSKEAMTQCWGLTGANRVRPVPCMNSRTA
jgi:hypothetical protein